VITRGEIAPMLRITTVDLAQGAETSLQATIAY
jgi:hypothetical protein